VVSAAPPGPPYALLAELTHRCPLRCAYCSNPVALSPARDELDTDTWRRVLAEAGDLGVVQVHLSGGEPLVRTDLAAIVAAARAHDLYSNLITSGIGLTADRALELADAGLNSVQVSVQAHDDVLGTRIAGTGRLEDKRAAAAAVLDAGLPLSMNVVLHRDNLDHLAEVIELCRRWGAVRLELANVQYYGWALLNASSLLPTRAQLERAAGVYHDLKSRLAGEMELLWIVPDWFADRPKPCMGGWAARSLTVAPDGTALPCPTAGVITSLDFPDVRTASLASVWHDSDAFRRYRGTDWLPEPCHSCDRRTVDFGGCRCQAFALVGDAGVTDPVCTLSPDRPVVDRLLASARAAGSGESGARAAGSGESDGGERPLVLRRAAPPGRR
jgi:pyrroloquinoline quinone biosynthesis protein E